MFKLVLQQDQTAMILILIVYAAENILGHP